MGTDFDLCCTTCGKLAGLEDNRRPDGLGKLLTVRAALEALAALAMDDLRLDSADTNRNHSMVPVAFFGAHPAPDHVIRVRSEYGEYEGDCNRWCYQDTKLLATGPSRAAPRYPCRAPAGHAGPHDPQPRQELPDPY